MIGENQGLARAKLPRVTKGTKESAPPGIATRWPTLLMIKLGRITMHRFTEALEPFGIRPRHVAALIELRDRGELTQQSLCGQLHLDPTNLVAILNDLEEKGYATRRRDPEDRRRHLVEVSRKGIAVIEKVSEVMDGVEDDLLDGLDRTEREQLEGLLTSIWEQSGGYDAWSQVAADVDDKSA
jgi:DNA-binding MarR family transcriptional regulator